MGAPMNQVHRVIFAVLLSAPTFVVVESLCEGSLSVDERVPSVSLIVLNSADIPFKHSKTPLTQGGPSFWTLVGAEWRPRCLVRDFLISLRT